MKLLFSILLLIFSLRSSSQVLTRDHYREDLDYFLTTIEKNYSYFDKKQTDWNSVKQIYISAADTVSGKIGFIALLEKIFYELYDHHASLNTNTPASQRLVPSGTDIWAEYLNGKPTIIQVRPGSVAWQSGLRNGMEIRAYNGVAVENAIQTFIGRTLKKIDKEARNFALRTLLAGKYNEEVEIKVLHQKQERVFKQVRRTNKSDHTPLSGRLLEKNMGYIRFNDRLWDNQTIPYFDSILQEFKNTAALILDLRNTASGGNTTVARGILGSFIGKDGFYQKHELAGEEKEFGVKRSWIEIVSPRQYIYTKPLVILVDHWTGSVGEGITIGFDALKRAVIVGTPMAGLNGANYSYTMPNSRIGFSFPAEKLFHVNGEPRESFKPHIKVNIMKEDGARDLILEEGIRFLKKVDKR